MSETAYADIRFELKDGIALVTLHRPEQLNAFSGRMGQELGDAWRRCDEDDAVRAVVVTGAGRAFFLIRRGFNYVPTGWREILGLPRFLWWVRPASAV